MADAYTSADDAHADAYSEGIRRRWATYWARRGAGLNGPYPGWRGWRGWRGPRWRLRWYVSLGRGADRKHAGPFWSHGQGKKALRRALRRHPDARLSWARIEPGSSFD